MEIRSLGGEQAVRGTDRAGVAVAASVAATYLLISWLRHRNHLSGAFDLGIFDQGAWQLSHGRAHVSLVERHILADHFSPVMVLFAPLYRLAATPVWLLAAQAAAVGATVLPMRALARHLGASPGLASALVAFSAPLAAAAVFDFHPAVLAVPFIAGTALYSVRDEPWPAALCAVAVVVCRADLGLVVVALAIVARGRTRAALVASGAVGLLAGAVVPGLLGAPDSWSPHFGHLGDGPVDALLDPLTVAGALLSEKAMRTMVLWLLPVGFLPLLKPRWLLVLVVAGLPVLLSRWGGTGQPWFHYGAPFAPIAIAGAVVAMSGPARWLDRRQAAAAALAGVATAALVASPLSPRFPPPVRLTTIVTGEPNRAIREVIGHLDADDRVSASNRAVPHLSHREVVYVFPFPFESVPEFFAEGAEPDVAAYGDRPVDAVVMAPADRHHLPLSGYEVVHQADGWLLLRPSPGD